MFYVYLLQSKSRFYVGSTSDLKSRMREHNTGLNISTKAYKPWELIFYEAYKDKNDMIRLERYLKTTQGRQALRRMIRAYLDKNDEYLNYYRSTTWFAK